MGQTAVEWLENQLKLRASDWIEVNLAIEQAKEMEATQKSKLITELTNSFFSNKGFKYNDEDNWASYCKNYTGTIKKSELRIGNWIEAENHNRQKVIIQVDDGFCIDFAQRNNSNPIPLTEEWLIKFGFEEYIDFGRKTGNFDKVPLCGFTYSINTNKVMIMHKGNNISHWLDIQIKYVHQLQNLYFSLTGEELEVKNV